MNLLASTVLLASLAVGIDTGYEPTAEGGLEYIIQIPPNLLGTLQPGEVISSEIPQNVQGVRRYRIQVGTDKLPRIQLPSSFNPADGSIQQTSGGSAVAPQPLNKQSPFQAGPVVNNAAAPGYTDGRYGGQPANAAPNGTTFVANSNAAQSQEFTELPLKLPAPPDGYPENYNGWNTANNQPAANPTSQPNTGMQNVPPANWNQQPAQQWPNQQPVAQQPQQQPNQQQPNQQWPNQMNQQTAQNGWNGQPNYNNQGVPYNGGYQQQGNPYYNNGQPQPGMVNVNGGFPNQQPGNMQGFPQQNYVQNDPRLNQGGLAQVPSGNFQNQPRLGETTAGATITGESKAPTFAANNAGSKATERTVTFKEELASPGDVSQADRAKAAQADTAEKPWLPMYVTGLAAVGSLLGNLYLAWMWLETRRRYRQIILERALAV